MIAELLLAALDCGATLRISDDQPLGIKIRRQINLRALTQCFGDARCIVGADAGVSDQALKFEQNVLRSVQMLRYVKSRRVEIWLNRKVLGWDQVVPMVGQERNFYRALSLVEDLETHSLNPVEHLIQPLLPVLTQHR